MNIHDNAFVVAEGLPDFSAITADAVVPTLTAIIDDYRTQFEAFEKQVSPTWEGIFDKLEHIDAPLDQAWSVLSHLMSVKNSDDLRQAHDEVKPLLIDLINTTSQSRPVYEAMVALRDGPNFADLSGGRQRIIRKRILGAELSGVGLQGAAKERYNAIQQELSAVQTQFGNNVLDSSKAFHLDLTDPKDIVGLPDSLLAMTAQAARDDGQDDATAEHGPWRLTLAFPSYSAFMKNSPLRQHRETMYRAWVQRASSGETDNSEHIRTILKLRLEESKLLGYETYADVSLATKMAPSISAVDTLLEDLRAASHSAGAQELVDLIAFAKKSDAPEADDFEPWDTTFWAEKLRESSFGFSEEQVRAYFPLPKVLDGIFAIAKELFDVAFEETPSPRPTWHKDVRFFELKSAEGNKIAELYLDPFARPGEKRAGAWMNDAASRSKHMAPEGKDVRLPIAYVVCNGTPPADDKPSMMTFDEVNTLFHEFGHALHHTLTTVDDAQVAGTNGVEWDAIELPSQFMENWMYHEPTLVGLTAHAESGEPMPHELFEKLYKARTFRAATAMLRQLTFAMTDMELHARYNPQGDISPFDVHRQIAARASIQQPIDADRFLNAFSHIFKGGYAAGYFSYKWAEVLSADAFGGFEEAGLDNPEARRKQGHKILSTIYQQGGSVAPMDLFVQYRGREPSTKALLRHAGLA